MNQIDWSWWQENPNFGVDGTILIAWRTTEQLALQSHTRYIFLLRRISQSVIAPFMNSRYHLTSCFLDSCPWYRSQNLVSLPEEDPSEMRSDTSHREDGFAQASVPRSNFLNAICMWVCFLVSSRPPHSYKPSVYVPLPSPHRHQVCSSM